MIDAASLLARLAPTHRQPRPVRLGRAFGSPKVSALQVHTTVTSAGAKGHSDLWIWQVSCAAVLSVWRPEGVGSEGMLSSPDRPEHKP